MRFQKRSFPRNGISTNFQKPNPLESPEQRTRKFFNHPPDNTRAALLAWIFVHFRVFPAVPRAGCINNKRAGPCSSRVRAQQKQSRGKNARETRLPAPAACNIKIESVCAVWRVRNRGASCARASLVESVEIFEEILFIPWRENCACWVLCSAFFHESLKYELCSNVIFEHVSKEMGLCAFMYVEVKHVYIYSARDRLHVIFWMWN